MLAAISGDLGEGDGAAPEVKKIGLKLGAAAPKPKSSTNLMSSDVFGGNDDTTTAQARAIIPIDYTGKMTWNLNKQSVSSLIIVLHAEDEKLAVQGVTVQPSANQKDKLSRQKEIADSIPVSREGLFAFKIDWELSEAKGVAANIMKPWIVKKIIEYLGEEETVLINFIVTKLSKPCNPEELLTELTPVLDVDAEPFVLKLWRMFVFSVLKAADE